MLLRDLYPVRRSVKMIESLCQRCGDKQAQAGKVEGDRNTQTVRQRKQEEEENQTIVEPLAMWLVFELITRIGPRSASGAHAGRRSRMKRGLRLVELADMLARVD